MTHAAALRAEGVPLLITLIASTALALGATALILQRLRRG